MLSPGQLDSAFAVYWREMDLCRAHKTYWALLHVTVCIPDICAALESANGETSPNKYEHWARLYLREPLLSPEERYRMRCKVLHQGRAALEQPGRYTGFSFAQPATTGEVDHLRVEGTTLVVDVGELSKEMRAAASRWSGQLEGAPQGVAAMNVEKHLAALVKVRQKAIPQPLTLIPGIQFVPIVINRTS